MDPSSTTGRISDLEEQARAILAEWPGDVLPTLLYHWTAPDSRRLGGILRDGRINTTPSDFELGHPGPPVVWLTDHPDALNLALSAAAGGSRYTARITVVVDGARRWSDFAFEHGIEPDWFNMQGRNNAGEWLADHWYVSERPIVADEFREIRLALADATGTTQLAYSGDALQELLRAPAQLRLP